MRRIGDEIWVHEEPLGVLGVPAGRRMTVVRLPSGELWVHSPAQLGGELRSQLDELGPLRFVVPASRLHGHLYMEQYAAAYPAVELLAAPGLARRRRDLSFGAELAQEADPRWAGTLDQTAFLGNRLITEIVFLHAASRTLVVGDLVWNVTRAMPARARLWAGWRPGVRPTPAFRATTTNRSAARGSIERMLRWDFDRIVTGHGEMVESGGRAALLQAYGWLRPAA